MTDFELKIDASQAGKPIPKDLKDKLAVFMQEMERMESSELVSDAERVLLGPDALWFVGYRTDAAIPDRAIDPVIQDRPQL